MRGESALACVQISFGQRDKSSVRLELCGDSERSSSKEAAQKEAARN